MEKFDVCVFGGCSIDKMYYQNEDGSYKDAEIMFGGKGANQAVAASRAGAKTAIITKLGDDEVGKRIINELNKNNVDTSSAILVKNLMNDYAEIYIDYKTADNDIHRFSGAIDNFSVDMIEDNKELLLNSSIIACQLKCPKEVTKALINFCYENNKFLILTPCRPQKLSISEKENIDLIEKISLITCNRKECETIFNTDNIEECIKQYPNKLIVTLGENGLMYYNGREIIKLPAVKVDNVIDTTGAGDTFNGNLACFLSKGMSLDSAIKKAMYASALKIQKKSAQAGMPYKEELDKFILNY